MPLGIELAAAWTSILSPADIRREVENNLDFLTTKLQDVPEKHHSIRAVFDSSWSLLTDDLREVLCKLSVFPAGFDQTAAMQVAEANLAQLSSLVDKSFLSTNHLGYFVMHSLLKQFASEKLNQQVSLKAKIENRFCQYYIDLLIRQESDLMGLKLLEARAVIQQDLVNIRAAVCWAARHWEVQAFRQVLFALLTFYAVYGFHEGALMFAEIAQLTHEALSGGPDPSLDPVFLCARTHQAFLHSNLGQIEESEMISRSCLAPLKILGMQGELSECFHNLGVNASFRGDYETAKTFLEDAVLLGRDSSNSMWLTYLLWLGHAYFLMGEYEQGLSSLQKCYELFDQRGTLWGVAFALSKMGMALDGLGEHQKALRHHQRALDIFEQVGNLAGKGYCLSRMSMSACYIKEFTQAQEFGSDGLKLFKKLGHRWGICTSLCHLGFANMGLGEIEMAKGYFNEALKRSHKDQMTPQSLYALAGIACTLKKEYKGQQASALYRYVQQHPQTPKPYLQLANACIGSLYPPDLKTANLLFDQNTSIDEIIEAINQI